MGGDAFRRVKSGEDLEISARAWNAFLESAAAVRGHLHDSSQDVATEFLQGDILKVKNTTDTDAPRFGVLGITGVVFNESDNAREFQNRPTLKGVSPSATTHGGRFAVLLDPIPAGKVGRAYVDGVCVVKLDLVEEGHPMARVIDGDVTKLRSHNFGSARIIYPGESGTGDRLAVVRLGDSFNPHRLCKTSAAFAKGTFATLDVWEDGTPPGETQSTGVTCTDVINKYANIGAGKFVSVARHGNGYWYVVSAECS